MKKIIRRFITWLYIKWGEPNIVACTRQQLLGTTHMIDLLELDAKEVGFLSKEAETVLNNDAFKMAVNNVKARVLQHIQYEAQTTKVIMYDRFTINGVALLEDELKMYVEDLMSRDDDFDEHEPF